MESAGLVQVTAGGEARERRGREGRHQVQEALGGHQGADGEVSAQEALARPRDRRGQEDYGGKGAPVRTRLRG